MGVYAGEDAREAEDLLRDPRPAVKCPSWHQIQCGMWYGLSTDCCAYKLSLQAHAHGGLVGKIVSAGWHLGQESGKTLVRNAMNLHKADPVQYVREAAKGRVLTCLLQVREGHGELISCRQRVSAEVCDPPPGCGNPLCGGGCGVSDFSELE